MPATSPPAESAYVAPAPLAVNDSAAPASDPPIEVTVEGRRSKPDAELITRASARELPGSFGDPLRAVESEPGVTPEARALFAARKQERTCVRYAKDARGRIRFRVAALAAVVSVAACSAPAVDGAAPATAHDADDRDMGDTIVDVDDLCPDTPTPESVEDGCPEADAGTTSSPTAGDAVFARRSRSWSD